MPSQVHPVQVTHFAAMFREPHEPVALKEWAVVCQALEEGKQILLLRKGGIQEETKHFSLQNTTFYLYPTYAHQRAELLKPEFQGDLEKTLQQWQPQQQEVFIRVLAHVVDQIQLSDPERLSWLMPYHIWTGDFAQARLKWKPYHPLHVLLIRAYRLEQPVAVTVRDDYLGCKSWIRIQESFDRPVFTPVLTDEQFARQRQEILCLFQVA